MSAVEPARRSLILRDPLNQIRGAFLPIALLVAVQGRPGDATILLLLLSLTLVPRLLELPRPFEAAFVAVITLQAGGNLLGFFRPDFGYDILIHIALTAAGAACAYLALIRLGVLPDPSLARSENHEIGVLLTVASIGMALGAMWEVVEGISDELLATHLVRGPLDTTIDLIANAIGAFIGGTVLVSWLRRNAAAGSLPAVDREPLGASVEPRALE